MTGILLPAAVLGGVGMLLGALLGVAAKAFRVERDERTEQIEALLPGANCGGCGFAGCAAMAQALAEGTASCEKCAALKVENRDKIAAILGIAPKETERRAAAVLCSGTCDKAATKCEYNGITDCIAAARCGGGEKSCRFACIGLGSCAGVCRFHALSVVNGVAHVDTSRCVGCGACAAICPRHIIRMVTTEKRPLVRCSSKEKGAEVQAVCKAGCIGCKICEKNCPVGAVKVVNHLAVIDHARCTGCGACAEKCPKKVIAFL